MTKKSFGHAEKIVDTAMAELGIRMDAKTDPQLCEEVLKEMGFHDLKTTFLPMERFFDEAKSEPISLKHLLENTRKGIVEKHPALVEFAEVALEKKWLIPSPRIKKLLHVMFLLEHITVAMCNNHTFFTESYEHLREKERLYGLDVKNIIDACRRVLFTTHSFFETLKVLTIDPYMVYFRAARGLGKSEFTKKEVARLYEKGDLNYIEYKLLSHDHRKKLNRCLELGKINIDEAGITEYENGSKKNSIAAFELNEYLEKHPPAADFVMKSVIPEHAPDEFYQEITTEGNVFPVFQSPQSWCSLYVSWNIAFCIGNVEDLEIVLPKLLIPSVVDSESEDFLAVRVMSLWLTIQTLFFRKSSGKISVAGPSQKKEMTEMLAAINAKYAFDLAKQETHENSKVLMRHYQRFFSRPLRNLFNAFYILLR